MSMEAALNLAELGYRVFPCSPKGKSGDAGKVRPLTNNGFYDATTEAEQIEVWWDKWPDACIGLATVGLLVVDIDGESNPWLADEPEKAASLAGVPLSLTPGGGKHFIYRRPEGKSWRCTVGKLAEKVDTRTDGGYIVVPPSRRADGAYRWAPDCELECTRDKLDLPPAWLIDALDEIESPGSRSPILTDGNSIPEGQRNNTLVSLAGTMRRVGMSYSEIAAALHIVNYERCKPPIHEKEVDGIAYRMSEKEPDQFAVATAENWYGQDRVPRLAELLHSEEDPGPIPAELLSIPGFVNEVIEYCLATAPYPDLTLAFAGALTLQGMLSGRKVRDQQGNYTNLYLIALASSGVGKNHPRKVNSLILDAAGLSGRIGNTFASGEGLEDWMYQNPASLFQVDEIDGLLLKVGSAKDARHEEIVNKLLNFYSEAGKRYTLRAKSGREALTIEKPSLSIFGTAVPKHFYSSLSERMLDNGFLARWLILEAGERGDGQDADERQPSTSLVDAARWWGDFTPNRSGNLSEWNFEPLVVERAESAAKHLRSFRKQCNDRVREASKQGDEAKQATWSRTYETSLRLSLVYACSADRESPHVTLASAEWATRFAEHQTKRVLARVGLNTCVGSFERKQRAYLEAMVAWHSEHGDLPAPVSIARRLKGIRGWSPKDHELVEESLCELEFMSVERIDTNGRPKRMVRLYEPSKIRQIVLGRGQ